MSIDVVCSDGNIRLASGTSTNNGRVEICTDGRWRTVCEHGWSEEDAVVTCRQLGYPSYGTKLSLRCSYHCIIEHAYVRSALGSLTTTNDFYPLGSGKPVGGDFQCTGTEKQLSECSFANSINCGHHEDAGVICPNHCIEGEIRLADTVDSLYSGRVETCFNGEWVSLCLDGWSKEEAQVVCVAIGSIKEGKEVYH